MRRWIGALVLGLLACGAVAFAQQPITPAASVTSSVYDGTTPLLPKFIQVNVSANGDNTLITAVPSRKIRILSALLVMEGTSSTLRFESGAGGDALTGRIGPLLGTPLVWPFNPIGWFETSSGSLLNLELGATTDVDGSLVYVEVP